jgi:hypothetical protein
MKPPALPSLPCSRRFWLAICVALVGTTAVAQTQSGQVFTCTNAAGRTLTSDRLIAECMDREQRLLARDGSLIRIVPPQLTADERSDREAQERRLAAEREAKAEAVRRDRSLLKRYPNEESHQKARESALDDVRTAIRLSELRQKDLERERKPLTQEAEFYQGKALPPLLKQQLDANEAAASAQRDVQVNQKAELERIGKFYDAELARLKKLWAGAAPGSFGLAASEDDVKAKPGAAAKPSPRK